MKESPILFSGTMVRALLDGSKRQTRRAFNDKANWHFLGGQGDMSICPYGQPGDRLYVKETFYAWGRWETRFSTKKGRDEWHFIDMMLECGKAYRYAAEDQPQPLRGKRTKGVITPTWWKRPAIFMPRAASRITLGITSVRVERLQDISEADAIAEGLAMTRYGCHEHRYPDAPCVTAKQGYQALWEQINGPKSWEANPWVWVVEFKRVEGGTP